MSRVVVLVTIALGAIACGGGGDDPTAAADPPSQSASASEEASAGGSTEAKSGSEADSGEADSAESGSSTRTDAAADLSEFVCEPDADGEWSASGVVTNSSGQQADYRVTVVVADGPGASVPGKRRTLTELDPESPEPFDIKRLPADGSTDATCQVEVLRLR